MFTHSKILVGFFVVFLVSCTATPKVHLKSAGMSMELSRQAYFVTSAAFSPDGKFALSGGHDKTLRLWDISTGKVIRQFAGHSKVVNSVAFSPDGRYALSGSHDATIKLWDITAGKEIKTFTGHTALIGAVHSVAFSPDGRTAISASLDNTIKLWDIATGKEIRTFPGHSRLMGSGVLSVAFSPDGRYALSGGVDGTLKLWDIVTGKEIRTYKGHSGLTEGGWVRSVAFSPDGRYALSAGGGPALKLWDIATGKEIRTFTGHSGFGGVLSVAFSPDGRYALSGGGMRDATIKVWDIATGKEVRTLTGHLGLSGGVISLAFSHNGRYILSGGGDGSMRLWNVSSGEEVAMMVGFENGEWMAITSEGYYNSSPKGDLYLSVKVENNTFTVKQFYDVFYRPDIVAAKLRGEDISGFVTITMEDAIKAPPPVVQFTSKPADTDKPEVKVCYQARSAGGGIGEVRLFHNGKLVQSDGYYKEVVRSTADNTRLAALNSTAIYKDLRSVAVKGKADSLPISSKAKGDVFEDCREVEAIPGGNEISLAAFNRSNTVQSYMNTVSFHSKLKAEDPHIYILGIGIDQYRDNTVNLKYAAKDARELGEKLRTQSATLYEPRYIRYELLTDRQATKENIIGKINEFSQKIKPNDRFILFAAGHGVLLQNQYYMLTHDYDGTVRENTMISSNEVVEASKKIKSLNQLLIFDTCHAGGMDYIISGLYDARMSVLAKKMGLHLYASANDRQAAMDGYKGNGLFTYTLLDGLNNNKQADKNRDGKVTVVGLGEYSKGMTMSLSKEIGHSQTPLIINFGKDSPLYKLP